MLFDCMNIPIFSIKNYSKNLQLISNVNDRITDAIFFSFFQLSKIKIPFQNYYYNNAK